MSCTKTPSLLVVQDQFKKLAVANSNLPGHFLCDNFSVSVEFVHTHPPRPPADNEQVAEHHRKQKKEAKKNPTTGRKIKDPGIPNSLPFKEEVR